jgi:hypothetical protein
MTLLQLPSNDQIEAALEELVADTQKLYDVRDTQDADECAFWKRQRNAFQKAQLHWLKGVRPTPTPSGYLVPSASRPGALVHRCYRAGDIWLCTCEAASFCWHHALITAIERAVELAARAVSWGSATEPPAPSLDPDDVLDPRDELALSIGAFGEEALPFVPTIEEIERERALAELAMDVADWY